MATLILVGWLASDALKTKSNLEDAQSNAEQSKNALLDGRLEDSKRFSENAQFHANQATEAVHSLPWTILSNVPWAGSPLKTTRQITDVVAGLTETVLLPATELGAGLSPDKLIDGARIDLAPLRAERSRLISLSDAASLLDAEAQAITKPTYFSKVGIARAQLQEQTSKLALLLRNAAIAAELAPPMLGADGPRSYLMVFQNNAEARGTGGLLGGLGILRFEDGIPSVEALGSNRLLLDASASVDLGPEFSKQYGYTNPYTDYRNSNLSSHFPYAAEIWRSMWEQVSGTRVDGVIATDPVALSYILGAVGAVNLPDGEVVDQDNVVELTESTAYLEFPERDEQTARKEYLQDIAKEVVKKLTGGVRSPRKLLDGLGRAVSQGRIAVWSAIPSEQSLLEQTPLAHIVPDDDAPYASVVVNNLGGNKMDYYLDREIEYAADSCDGQMRNSTITVRLTNTAPDGLPPRVAGLEGLNRRGPTPRGWVQGKFAEGTMITSVRVLATKGAKLLSVLSNGERTTAIIGTERGHPTYEVQLAIPPGKSGELTFQLSEPTSSGQPLAPVQPLTKDVTPKISVPQCSA